MNNDAKEEKACGPAQADNSLDVSKLEGPLVELETKLHGILARRRRSQRNALIAGVVMIPLVAVYFGFVHKEFSRWTDPDYLVNDQAVPRLKDAVPVAINWLRKNGPQQAGKLADTAADQLVENLPVLRELLEGQTIEHANFWLRDSRKQAKGELKRALVKNQPQIQKIIDDLDDPNEKDVLRLTLGPALKDIFDDKVDPKLNATLVAVRDIKSDLRRLSKGNRLTPEEALERDLIAVLCELARRRQKEAKESGEMLGDLLRIGSRKSATQGTLRSARSSAKKPKAPTPKPAVKPEKGKQGKNE